LKKVPLRVLLVEDSEDDAVLTMRALQQAGFDISHRRVDTADDMNSALDQHTWDLIICDYVMPQFSAPAALRVMHQRDLDLPFLIVSGTVGEDIAVDAMKAGAHDYFRKDNLMRLGAAVQRELRDAMVRRDRRRAEEALELSNRVLEITNRHTDMQAMLEECAAQVRKYCDCAAAGVRLVDPDGRIPYLASQGFSREFLEQESPLSIKKDSCACISVLKGMTDGDLPYYTDGGSFFHNGTTRFLEEISHQEREQAGNICNQFGYESVALVPICPGSRPIGLVHVADPSENAIPLPAVKALEDAAKVMGAAIQRVQAQQALKESEEVYRTLVETSPDSITLTDLQGIILKANQGALAIHGFKSEEELIGKNSFDLIAPSDKQRAAENMKKTLETGSSGTIEYALLRKDGSTFKGELSATLVRDLGGRPHQFMAIVRDVTERTHIQSQLAQADRMASVGMLAAGVAHEINNPLAYVLYNLESLARDMPRVTAGLSHCWSVLTELEGTERALEILGEAREFCEQGLLDDLVARTGEAAEGARRIRDIVRDLKTFSRVEEDRRVSVWLTQVIETAINMAFNEIKYRARLVKDFKAVAPVRASEGRLSQVFLNLLVNAAQAIDEGDVEHNEIRVRTWTEGDEVLAEVRDTGRGIPPENRGRLFDPFFTTKPVGVGSGLGLSICHNIVASYGGRIEVESEIGQGSRFIVHLPVSPAVEPETRARVEEEEPKSAVRGRILVVDDEPMIGSTIKRVFRREHDLVVAGSGAEGKEILSKDTNFDLILCDVMMPDISGMDLYEWLNQKTPALARRIVFITGGAFTPRAREFLDRIPNLQVEKPFDPKNLRSLVRDLLSPPGKRDKNGE
jgi:PAS domain S-box-containing protein